MIFFLTGIEFLCTWKQSQYVLNSILTKFCCYSILNFSLTHLCENVAGQSLNWIELKLYSKIFPNTITCPLAKTEIKFDDNKILKTIIMNHVIETNLVSLDGKFRQSVIFASDFLNKGWTWLIPMTMLWILYEVVRHLFYKIADKAQKCNEPCHLRPWPM